LAKDSAERDVAVARLKSAGIPYMIYYPTPLHKLPVFANSNSYDETFPISTDYCARTFSLPFHPYLTEETQNRVIATVLGEQL